MHDYRNIRTADEAKREAIARLKDDCGLNPPGSGCEEMEFAYSPAHHTVGVRPHSGLPFRVFNIYYPMYHMDEGITDWVSVGNVQPYKRGPRK